MGTNAAPLGLRAATMTSHIDLSGRHILVTGAAGGLGEAIAATLAESGAHLALSDHPQSRVHDIAARLSAHSMVTAIPADLAADAGSLPQSAFAALGALDGLVNAAGIMQTTPFRDVTAADWQQIMTVNLTATFQTIHAAAKLMPSGSMVNVASVAARSARANAAPYAASKSGVVSLTKSAAAALGPAIRVNAVCPGVFMTPMWQTIIAERDAEFGAGAGIAYFDQVRSAAPLGREGQPHELATVVAFLLSDLSSFITGQAINVCGGLEMH